MTFLEPHQPSGAFAMGPFKGQQRGVLNGVCVRASPHEKQVSHDPSVPHSGINGSERTNL
jgi:hypothetical protein